MIRLVVAARVIQRQQPVGVLGLPLLLGGKLTDEGGQAGGQGRDLIEAALMGGAWELLSQLAMLRLLRPGCQNRCACCASAGTLARRDGRRPADRG